MFDLKTFAYKCVFILFSFILVLFTSSCELGFNPDKPDIYVLSYGNSYGSSGTVFNQYIDYGMSDFETYTPSGQGAARQAPYLNCTINDAIDVSNAFGMLAKKGSYKCTTSTTLVTASGGVAGRYASFYSKLQEIGKEIKDTDILIVFYSGHGGNSRLENLSGLSKNYLVFSNQLVDFDYFKNDIEQLNGTKFIICDACYSGSLFPANSGVTINPDTESNSPVKILFKSVINEYSSLFMLSASRNDEESFITNSGNSEMTKALLAAIGGGRNRYVSLGTIAALKNNRLTVLNIAKYVYEIMSEDKAHSNVPLTNGRNDDLILFQF